MKHPSTYVTWDLETTGLDAKTEKIIEIGAVKIVDGQVTDRKSWLLDHGIFLSDKTTEITGITDDMIDAEAVNPATAFSEFMSMFEGVPNCANVTHNGYRFDLPFLMFALPNDLREVYNNEMFSGMIDTAVLVKAKKLNMQRFPDESFLHFAERVMSIRAFGVKYNIPLCCEELDIDTSNATFHRALGDATLTNEIYKKLCL